MSHSWDYDAIVIGSGPGGEGAAMGLVKQGARVAVIERYHNVGGGCTHWGTIPSKALRHAVSRIIEFNQNPLYSDHSRLLRSSFADILNHADSVINQQTLEREMFGLGFGRFQFGVRFFLSRDEGRAPAVLLVLVMFNGQGLCCTNGCSV